MDAVERYANEFLTRAIKANGLYEGKYPMVSGLARPLIADEVVKVARDAGATTIGHGCTGKGNDQVRFEVAFGVLAPDLEVIAPIRDANIPREKAVALADEWGIPIASIVSSYSIDENLWGRTADAGRSRTRGRCRPRTPSRARRLPRIGRTNLPRSRSPSNEDSRWRWTEPSFPCRLVRRLDDLAGSYGFGRVDMIENRRVGINRASSTRFRALFRSSVRTRRSRS